ncbi:MAG: efflux RND transporter periplasmic adaptor subunit [Bacteroidales bacterium]
MTRKTTLGAILAVLVLSFGMLAACNGKGGEAGAAAAAPVAERPPVAVSIAPVVTADLAESVDVVGSLAPKFSAEVKSEVSGIIKAVYVTEWVPVRKGQKLAQLDTTETEAGIAAIKAGVAQAQVAEARAKREYERAQQLKEFGLITPQNFDDAKSALEAAQAATSAAQLQVKAAETRLAKASIASPVDGIVALRGVNVGDRVENMGGGSPMFRIVDNRLLDLTVSVPSTRLADVKVGQPLEFTTDSVPGRTFMGKVMFINPAIDEATRGAKVVAEVPNPGGVLKGGAFVKGRIVTANRAGVVQVPRDALLNWNVEQQTADVFVINAGKAEKRQVKIGGINHVSVQVTSGVTPGEQVVTRGGFALRPGDRVTVTGQGA